MVQFAGTHARLVIIRMDLNVYHAKLNAKVAKPKHYVLHVIKIISYSSVTACRAVPMDMLALIGYAYNVVAIVKPAL